MRRSAIAVLLTAGTFLLGGCVALPTDGPIVDSDVIDVDSPRQASDIDARPPEEHASRSDVVSGFLDAMTAWPVQTTVAKKYLTDEAAASWKPDAATVVYADTPLATREMGNAVAVQLTAADALDRSGAWRGAVSRSDLALTFHLSIEHGEYRIADPRDALMVPASWFQQRYRQVSLYFFDPIAQILVPEPVFVPEGDQLATSLVAGLLAGPPPRAQGLVRSFVPQGLSIGLSVPIDNDGVADIDLVGIAGRSTSEEAELMLAQLAWTLRQVSSITAFRVTIDGVPLPIRGGASRYPVNGGDAFDPAGGQATTVYGLSGGRLVWGRPGDLAVASGPFGDINARLDAVAVRPDGLEAAAVDTDRHRVRIGSVGGAGNSALRTVLSGGTYARPTWDAAGRLWVVDQRPIGARVLVVENDEVREVRVQGFSGRDVRALAVSRDGTRLVGVVRTSAGDEVLCARVQINGRGRVARTRAPFVVRQAEDTRITDLAWSSPVQIGLLTTTVPHSLYEVDVVAADGASVGVDGLSTILSGEPVVGFAAAPVSSSPMMAVYVDQYVDLGTEKEYDADSTPLTQLDFAG